MHTIISFPDLPWNKDELSKRNKRINKNIVYLDKNITLIDD